MNSLESAEDIVDLAVDLLELRGHGHVARHGGPSLRPGVPSASQTEEPWYGNLLKPPFPVGSGGCGWLQPLDAERDRRRRRIWG